MTILRSLVIALSLCALATAQIPTASGGEPRYRVRIASPNPTTLRATLESLEYDVGCLHCTGGEVEVVVSELERRQLLNAGLQPKIMETARPLWNKLGLPGAPGTLGTHFGGGGGVPSGYVDLAGVDAFLASMAAAYPNLAQVVDLTATYGPGATFEGRAINAIKISDNVASDEDEAEILFVSCHHCREIVTPEVALYIINELLSNYGTDPAVTALVDQNEIWVAPVWNPDGYEYVWNTNNLWRKNRKPFSGGDVGVDLNRNYDLNWQAQCGSSSNPSSGVFRGPAPESEEETQTMVAFARARRFAKVMDFHSYGREVLQSYRCAPLPPALEAWIDAEAVALSSTNGYSFRDPSADSEHYQWEIKEITSYAFLTETHSSFQPSYSSAQSEAASVWPLNLAFMQEPVRVTGRVTDATTGAAIPAEITINGFNFQNGETRHADQGFGRYHLFLPDGTHTLTFNALGFAPETRTVTVSSNATTVEDVAMSPGGPFVLNFTTSGNGTSDASLTLYNVPTGTAIGLTLFSLDVSQSVGQGSVFGIVPDLLTFDCLFSPPAPTNPLHWSAPFVPGAFPLGTYDVPAGTIQLPAGTQVDGVAVAFGPFYSTILGTTPVVRVTF